jgi:phosphoglycerol transferase MdoB-like AlkP superfamily enzyme
MIIILFIYSLIFIALGLVFIFKNKKLLGGMFILLAVMLAIVGAVAVALYPHIWPF